MLKDLEQAPASVYRDAGQQWNSEGFDPSTSSSESRPCSEEIVVYWKGTNRKIKFWSPSMAMLDSAAVTSIICSWHRYQVGVLSELKVGLVFFKSRLQNDVRRFGRGLAGLFSQQNLLNLIKRCSNQHAEIFMNETNMRRFESVFTNRITTSWHQKSKI